MRGYAFVIEGDSPFYPPRVYLVAQGERGVCIQCIQSTLSTYLCIYHMHMRARNKYVGIPRMKGNKRRALEGTRRTIGWTGKPSIYI